MKKLNLNNKNGAVVFFNEIMDIYYIKILKVSDIISFTTFEDIKDSINDILFL